MTNFDQEIEKLTALEKSRDATKRMSVISRKLRLSTSNRSDLYRVAGLRPRLMDKVFRWAVIFITLFILIAPIALSGFYFGYAASDQYQSEARLVVRTASPAIGKDQLGKVMGLPSAKIIQDTQIVTNFIHSRAIVETLEKDIDVRKRFTRSDVDPVARLAPDATYEDFLTYWDKMVHTSVSPASGIITIKVRAFSAEDAREILAAVIRASEQTINQMTDRIWKDVTVTARTNLDKAAEKLRAVRERVATQQNKTGVLTVASSSAMLSTLLTTLQKEKFDLEQSYSVKLANLSRDAPQMMILRREIQSKQAQVDDLKRQIAGAENGSKENLADVSVDLSSLQFETQLAEQQFAASVRTFEQVQFISKQQLMYLDSFLEPSLPDKGRYPRRVLSIALIAAASVFAWLFSYMLLSMVRNKVNS